MKTGYFVVLRQGLFLRGFENRHALCTHVGGNACTMKYLLIVSIQLLLSCENKPLRTEDLKETLDPTSLYTFRPPTEQLSGDTTITLVIKGDPVTFAISHQSLGSVGGMQNIIDKFQHHLRYDSETVNNVTGRGVIDKCRSTIEPQNDGFLVTHRIWRNDSLIWYDTLLINDRISYYWNNDSIYFKLKPIFQFYTAYKYFRYFVEARIDTNSEFYNQGRGVIRNIIGYESDPAYWDKYLGSFTGRGISKLSIADGGLYLWDERKKKFIDFYEP
jgi:hypothetical protein